MIQALTNYLFTCEDPWTAHGCGTKHMAENEPDIKAAARTMRIRGWWVPTDHMSALCPECSALREARRCTCPHTRTTGSFGAACPVHPEE